MWGRRRETGEAEWLRPSRASEGTGAVANTAHVVGVVESLKETLLNHLCATIQKHIPVQGQPSKSLIGACAGCVGPLLRAPQDHAGLLAVLEVRFFELKHIVIRGPSTYVPQ